MSLRKLLRQLFKPTPKEEIVEHTFDVHHLNGKLASSLYSANNQGLESVGDSKRATDYYDDGTPVIITRTK